MRVFTGRAEDGGVVRRVGSSTRCAVRCGLLALALLPLASAAEQFVYLGAQPDGVEIYVQASPPSVTADGRRQGWFRTVPKGPQQINDETGAKRTYADMLALNVADCGKRTMAASAMLYRDEKQAIVARYEIAGKELELRKIKANTLGEAMLDRLCVPKKPAAPALSPGTASPYK
jgi:hypothetical protein